MNKRGPNRGAASPQNIARTVALRLNAPIKPAGIFALERGAQGIPLAGLDLDGFRGCRWPVNAAEPGEQHLFCGEPAEPAKPYCLNHCMRAGAGYQMRAA